MIPLISWRPSNRDDALLPAKREGPIAFWGSSGVCVGCCLGEDANLAATPLVQSLFFRPRGRWPPKGRRRHVMVVGALVPTDAARVATSGATVYTSAPKRLRGAILADLCTLLRPLTCPQRCNSVHECPKMAPKGRFRQSVYTPAFPRPLARPGGVMGPTTSTAPWLLLCQGSWI